MTQKQFISIGFFTVFMGLSSFTQAQATEKLQSELFSRYLISQHDYIQTIEGKARDLFKINTPQCKSPIVLKRRNPIKLSHTDFNIPDLKATGEDRPVNIEKIIKQNSHPKKGQWIERFFAQSCNNTIKVNILVNAVSPQNPPVILSLLNGDTKIDLLHQEKAVKSIHSAFDKVRHQCADYGTISNTRFIGYKGKETPISKEDHNLGWYELWTIKTCKTNQDVQMVITPAQGGQYDYTTRIAG